MRQLDIYRAFPFTRYLQTFPLVSQYPQELLKYWLSMAFVPNYSPVYFLELFLGTGEYIEGSFYGLYPPLASIAIKIPHVMKNVCAYYYTQDIKTWNRYRAIFSFLQFDHTHYPSTEYQSRLALLSHEVRFHTKKGGVYNQTQTCIF